MSQFQFSNPMKPGGGPQPPKFLAPGRVIESVERYMTPSGRSRELQKWKETLQDSQGIFRTRALIDVIPPLDCSCVPKDMNDLAECSRCLSMVCASKHSDTCSVCGRVYCSACMTQVSIEETPLLVCLGCARQIKEPAVLRIIRKAIWG